MVTSLRYKVGLTLTITSIIVMGILIKTRQEFLFLLGGLVIGGMLGIRLIYPYIQRLEKTKRITGDKTESLNQKKQNGKEKKIVEQLKDLIK